MRPGGIHLSGALRAEAIEPVALCHEIIGDFSEAFSAGKLADQHGEELAPAVVGTEFLTGMMHCGKGIEFISRDKCKQLHEDSVVIGMARISLACMIFS